MDLQGNWLFRGYFGVSAPSGGPSITQQVRDRLAIRMGRSPSAVKIASYPVGPAWRHTFWWREGAVDYAEAQFFARIAEDYPVLSVGVSVEKGLEEPRAAPSAKRRTYLMERQKWDWQRFIKLAAEVLRSDVPECSSLLSRPVTLRLDTHQFVKGKAGARERAAFVFLEGAWHERHLGKAKERRIIDHLRDLDQRRDWWVNAYLACDLFPDEVRTLDAEALASALWGFSAVRQRLRSQI
ncbi:MAG: hypothetical protein FJY82_05420 [Candidatus Aminicenantes bacterium]|nr:hypothetical protein [Candidatus Aminicenantes bacterium]